MKAAVHPACPGCPTSRLGSAVGAPGRQLQTVSTRSAHTPALADFAQLGFQPRALMEVATPLLQRRADDFLPHVNVAAEDFLPEHLGVGDGVAPPFLVEARAVDVHRVAQQANHLFSRRMAGEATHEAEGFQILFRHAADLGDENVHRMRKGELHMATRLAMGAAGLVLLPLSLLFETRSVVWSGQLVFALLWLVLVLSLGAITLLLLLIRRGAATQVSSLMYLVPPVTALIAWWVFDETLTPLVFAGMAVSVAGVALVVRAPVRPLAA